MKKVLLLLVIGFLPVLSFGQVVDLVTWNGMSAPQPDYNTTPQAVIPSGLSISSVTPEGYKITGTGISNPAVNYNKYIQFKVNAGQGMLLDLKQFKFNYLRYDNGSSKKIQIRYSTSGFPDNMGLELGTVNTTTTNTSTPVTLNFPANFKIQNGQELSLRIYFYDNVSDTPFFISHFIEYNNSNQGPRLVGESSLLEPTLLPLVRWTKTDKTPTILAQGVQSSNIEGVNGLSWGESDQFFQKIMNGDTSLSESKYIELSVGVDGTHQLALDKLNFEIRKANENFYYQIRYSKDKNNFNTTYTQLVSQTLVSNTSYTQASVSLSNIYLAPSETVYFRIYAYSNGYSELHLKLSEGNKTGPIITGLLGGDEHCMQTTTWENGAWSNGKPDKNKKVIIKSDYTINGANFQESLNACELKIETGFVVTVRPNYYLFVENNVINNGKIIVENNGSFIQGNNNATYTGAATSFTLKRYTQPVRRYDFTYWSSPVAEANWTLYNLSPNTLGDKYYSYNPTGAWQIHYNGAENMKTGKGYIVRAPQTFEINNQQVDENTKFIGIPNNGVKTFTAGGPGSFNLIGNPYPSAMDADKFITENQNSITGTLYFWTHNTAVTNYVYSAGDYATYTKLGGAGTQKAASGGVKPTGKIASGQGFFVERKNNPNATITYNNEMRLTGDNNVFYKPAPTEADDTVYKHRFWLNVSNANNAYSEMLLGYMTGATDGLDDAYDGKTFGGSVIALYSKLDATNLVVQAKSLPFDENDVIPLGYKSTVAGEFTINLNEFDGVFDSQDVFLVDNLNNTITNLKEMDYVFTTDAGIFDNRFEIKFINTTLGMDTPTVDESSIIVFRNGNQIDIKSKDQSIDQVTVYDLLGKVIFEKNKINAQSCSTSQLMVSNQVVIVKVITDSKAQLVKKIIMN